MARRELHQPHSAPLKPHMSAGARIRESDGNPHCRQNPSIASLAYPHAGHDTRRNTAARQTQPGAHPPSHAPAHPAALRQISISLQFRGIAEIFGSQSQYLAAKVRFREFVRFPARHRRRATVRNRWNSANFSIHSSHPTCRQISISRPNRRSS